MFKVTYPNKKNQRNNYAGTVEVLQLKANKKLKSKSRSILLYPDAEMELVRLLVHHLTVVVQLGYPLSKS